MPRFAIFAPLDGDPASGPIIQITRKLASDMAQDERAFVEVPEELPADLDGTHHVIAGAIVLKTEGVQ
ncbi:hypothetical protein HY78_14465 [Rhizorhabdus wittichii DC-6]|nr:hypothetical protein HY78_14465 [Rhizorhabdus wittichii DC-6]